MEKFDLYDCQRQKLNKTLERNETVPEGCGRLVIHICIFNSNGEMLIQQRSNTKKTNPNIWDITVGGCVQSGETSWQAAQRELSEELGIQHDFSNTLAYLTLNFIGGFDDYFLIKKDINIKKDVRFTDNEVSQVKWASQSEILQMIENKTFIPYHPHLISLMFDMYKTDYGAFQYNIFAKKTEK